MDPSHGLSVLKAILVTLLIEGFVLLPEGDASLSDSSNRQYGKVGWVGYSCGGLVGGQQ